MPNHLIWIFVFDNCQKLAVKRFNAKVVSVWNQENLDISGLHILCSYQRRLFQLTAPIKWLLGVGHQIDSSVQEPVVTAPEHFCTKPERFNQSSRIGSVTIVRRKFVNLKLVEAFNVFDCVDIDCFQAHKSCHVVVLHGDARFANFPIERRHPILDIVKHSAILKESKYYFNCKELTYSM